MSKKEQTSENPQTGNSSLGVVVGSNTWGVNFQNIIFKTSEAWVKLRDNWWPIHDFELECGLFRIDVMGKLEVHHMVDCEQIKMDGIEYKLEDVYE